MPGRIGSIAPLYRGCSERGFIFSAISNEREFELVTRHDPMCNVDVP